MFLLRRNSLALCMLSHLKRKDEKENREAVEGHQKESATGSHVYRVGQTYYQTEGGASKLYHFTVPKRAGRECKSGGEEQAYFPGRIGIRRGAQPARVEPQPNSPQEKHG